MKSELARRLFRACRTTNLPYLFSTLSRCEGGWEGVRVTPTKVEISIWPQLTKIISITDSVVVYTLFRLDPTLFAFDSYIWKNYSKIILEAMTTMYAHTQDAAIAESYSWNAKTRTNTKQQTDAVHQQQHTNARFYSCNSHIPHSQTAVTSSSSFVRSHMLRITTHTAIICE